MPPHILDTLGNALAFVAAAVAAGSTFSVPRQDTRNPGATLAETIRLNAGAASYQNSGEFLLDSRPALAPVEQVTVPGIEIMKYQVSLADYDRCVKAGACDRLDTP